METVAKSKCINCKSVLHYINNPKATPFKLRCPVCGRKLYGDTGILATEEEILREQDKLNEYLKKHGEEERKYEEWIEANADFLRRFLYENDFYTGKYEPCEVRYERP